MAQRFDSATRPRRPRGARVPLQARADLQALLGPEPLQRERLIEYLHRLQDTYGSLSRSHRLALAEALKLAPVEVDEVASFYHHFDLSEGATDPSRVTLRLCNSLSCQLAGAESLIATLEQHLGHQLRIEQVPCVGRCADAPVAVLGTRPIDLATPEKITAALSSGDTDAALPAAETYASYRAAGGYATLQRLHAGDLSHEQVLQTLNDSGLRGLGGAGFPVGRKWQLVAAQPAPRYLAVNLDEGEPGTFKDRYYLERHPHRLLEGALIAAKVVGCGAIYLYLRDEYAGCRALLEQELAALQADPPVPLPRIELRRGAGAYICGEESAMLESLEGKRGIPRQRPPFVAEVGLFGRPTLVQNGESLYWAAQLIAEGSAAFAAAGRRGRRGLRTFSVSGRVAKPGVYRAPAGISLQELIDEYAGGMASGHRLYGYFPGGASGGMLPASLADLPLDFDTLQEHGCFIGSAAIIVFSHQDSARELALNCMRFFAHESCGQCTPCRVGTVRAASLMAGATWDTDALSRLAEVMSDASICGLGQAAPNPLRCALRYFPEEFSDAERQAWEAAHD